MENEGQQVNENRHELSVTTGNNTTHQHWNIHEDAVDDMLGAEDHADSDSVEDDNDEEDEDYLPKRKTSSKRVKRHTTQQIQELEAAYRECAHPDVKTQRALGRRIGMEASQVKVWFQNRRTEMKKKAHAQQNKLIQQENAALLPANLSLREAMLTQLCVTCGGGTVPTKPSSEKQRLLTENARLKDEYLRASAFLSKVIREAAPSEPPVSSTHRARSIIGYRADGAALLRHAETAMKQFLMLATKGEPMWLPTTNGETLNFVEYDARTSPRLFGLCPKGFVVEATRETAMVRSSAADLMGILTNAARWSEMFSGVVASVTAGDVVSSSIFASCDGLIQLMNAELWVQSPRVPNRSVNFLRFSKMKAERQWVVMDVSVDGILGREGSRMTDLNLNNSAMPSRYTGCRLLPSGCLIEDMSNGYCKVTWIVHAEYDETTVPMLFKPLFLAGQALGARRWLAVLQRQCEYLAVFRSSSIPGIDSTVAAISGMGRRGILQLAQQMMTGFYAAVSGPVTQASSNVNEWIGSIGTGAESFEVAVRKVTWKKLCSVPGELAGLVLSASTTVWLPSTPPQAVFDYLCNEQRRGEWDTLTNGAAVKEMVSLDTGHLQGNAVSVLCPDASDGTDSKMLILQQACTDASCSLVVYTPIEEKSMRAVMNGGDHASVFFVPSGFAILPDGHGKARHAPVAAPSTSRAAIDHNNTAGSLLTMAFQTLLPSPPSDNLGTGAFEDVVMLLCRAIKKIMAAVKADVVIPA
ncbi:homeobox-leucine zipper protein ROC6-like [Phragmites australis]|uniref:homeobox-leucine zipper protein ROC6-like n=1 Tax=Phragmites australis TaxID=29695 RepID=UPI002D7672B1|nr:homeobox-leucine zipper protein ROC6-like [Phragmites australis]